MFASVAQGSEYASIWLNNALWRGSEYAWSTYHGVLNEPLVLNMPELRIWQGYEHTKVRQGVEYV